MRVSIIFRPDGSHAIYRHWQSAILEDLGAYMASREYAENEWLWYRLNHQKVESKLFNIWDWIQPSAVPKGIQLKRMLLV